VARVAIARRDATGPKVIAGPAATTTGHLGAKVALLEPTDLPASPAQSAALAALVPIAVRAPSAAVVPTSPHHQSCHSARSRSA
jgi:hypothetical protein